MATSVRPRPMLLQDEQGPQMEIQPPNMDGVTGGLRLRRPRPMQQQGQPGQEGADAGSKAPIAPTTEINADPQGSEINRRAAPEGGAPSRGAQPPAQTPAPIDYSAPAQIQTRTAEPMPGLVPGPGVITHYAPGYTPPATGAGGAPAPAPFAPPQAAAPAAPRQIAEGVTGTPITGNETPESIGPSRSASLQKLLEQAQAAVTRGLENPSVYDDDLYKQARDQAFAGIDQSGVQQEDALNAEMARRGLSYTSTYGAGRESLGSSIARQKQEASTGLLRERASTIAQGRTSALAAAQSLLGQQHGMEAGARDEARGERGYVDTLRDKAHQGAINETNMSEAMKQQRLQQFLQYVQSGLGYGQAAGASTILGNAANTDANIGQGYGIEEQMNNDQVGELAKLAAYYFGGGSR